MPKRPAPEIRDRPLRRSGASVAVALVAVARAAGPTARATAVAVGPLTGRAVTRRALARRPGPVAERAARAAAVATGTVAVPARTATRATATTTHVALGALLRLHRDALGDQVLDRRVTRTDPVHGRVDLGRAEPALGLAHLVGQQQGDDDTGGAGAGGTARPVQVGLGVGRRVVVQDQRDVVDVDAAGGDVGGHEDRRA